MSSTASIILKFLITKEKVINIHKDIAVLFALFGEPSLKFRTGIHKGISAKLTSINNPEVIYEYS